MKCQFCQRQLDNRFQAIYSTRLDKNLAFCPFCYSMALTHYYVVCTGCLTTYWLRSERTLNNFTFAYQNECGFCLEAGYSTERILEQWRRIWNTELRLSPLYSSPIGIGDQPDDEEDCFYDYHGLF